MQQMLCSHVCREAILYWQQWTIRMMYRKIGEALSAAGSKAHPTDYLNFFCLGTCQPECKTFQKSYIYVHAKVGFLVAVC